MIQLIDRININLFIKLTIHRGYIKEIIRILNVIMQKILINVKLVITLLLINVKLLRMLNLINLYFIDGYFYYYVFNTI